MHDRKYRVTYIVTRIRHRTGDTAGKRSCSGRCKITRIQCPRNSSKPFSMLRVFVTMSGVTNIVGSEARVAATNERKMRSNVRWKRLLVVARPRILPCTLNTVVDISTPLINYVYATLSFVTRIKENND